VDVYGVVIEIFSWWWFSAYNGTLSFLAMEMKLSEGIPKLEKRFLCQVWAENHEQQAKTEKYFNVGWTVLSL